MLCDVSSSCIFQGRVLISFFFNDTPTTEIYTLSLHDALPISWPTNRTVSGAIAGHAPILIGEPSLEVTAQPQIRLPTLSSTICRPVRTATTPGIASAAEESMLLTLAW